MSSRPDTHLTEEELITLDTFLLSEACDGAALSIDEAHGFLTAIIAGPAQVAQKEWLTEVWGQPRFADAAEKQRLTELLLRLHDEIATTLQAGRSFEPLVVEVEEDGEATEAYEGWCFGFMLGVAQHQEMWDRLPRDEKMLIAPMAQLALLNSEEAVAMRDEEYASWIELIPGAVMGLYRFWHGTEGQGLVQKPSHGDT